MLSAVHCLLLAAALGVDGPVAAPPLKSNPVPLPAVKKARHYVVQVKLIEVDDQGRETVLGEPKLQTAGGNTGVSIDHSDGRRFEFTMKLTDRLGTDEDLIPAKGPAVGSVDMLKKLDQKLELNVSQQSRKEILREISRRAGVTIAVDPESARSVVAEMESPIDLKVTNEPVSAIIDRVIEPLKLEYTVKHEAILIASAEKLIPAPDEFLVKTYTVADLVTPRVDSGSNDPNFTPLIERIKSTVFPSSWERKESAATIRPFNSTLSIVVRQTPLGHAAIERLLEKMRRDLPQTISE